MTRARGAGAHLHRGAHVLAGEPLVAEPHVVVGAPRGPGHLHQNRLAPPVHPVAELPGCRRPQVGAALGPGVTDTGLCPESPDVAAPVWFRRLAAAHPRAPRDFPNGAEDPGERKPVAASRGLSGRRRRELTEAVRHVPPHVLLSAVCKAQRQWRGAGCPALGAILLHPPPPHPLPPPRAVPPPCDLELSQRPCGDLSSVRARPLPWEVPPQARPWRLNGSCAQGGPGDPTFHEVLLIQLDPAEMRDGPQGDIEVLGHAHRKAAKVHLELSRCRCELRGLRGTALPSRPAPFAWLELRARDGAQEERCPVFGTWVAEPCPGLTCCPTCCRWEALATHTL